MLNKKCSLCGGDLKKNRCTFCGLDNSLYEKNSSPRKRTNEQPEPAPAMEPIHRAETSKPKQKAAVSQTIKQNYQKQQTYRPGQPAAVRSSRPAESRNINSKKPKTGGLTAVIILIIIALAALSVAVKNDAGALWAEIFGSGSSSNNTDEWYDDGSTYDYDSADYDPYAHATREIPATGESYETVLGNGIYRVGVHIPEGIYHVELAEGTGGMEIEDDENLIYHYVSFGTEEDYGETMSDDDIRLYNNAEVSIDSSVILKFVTDNAQPMTQELKENPLSDPVLLDSGEYTSGFDTIPEGIYDISAITTPEDEYGYSSVSITYPNGYSEYLWVDGPDYAPFTDEYSATSARNIVIVDGTSISIEYGGIVLTPSEGYYEIDYSHYISE